MSEFQVGDRVVLTTKKSFDGIESGTHGTITSTIGNDYWPFTVHFDGSEHPTECLKAEELALEPVGKTEVLVQEGPEKPQEPGRGGFVVGVVDVVGHGYDRLHATSEDAAEDAGNLLALLAEDDRPLIRSITIKREHY